MSPRLTRSEQQANTRQCLLHSAARLFTSKGMAHTSVDEVATEAGFTKGAFYSNFKSKEELFLALLDERFAERIAVMDALLDEEGSFVDQARAGGDEFQEYLRSDPEWERLFFEFAAHAARDEEFRQELVARYRTLIDRIAAFAQRGADAAGFTPPGPVSDFALMIFMAGNGTALQQLLDPESVPPDLFAGMLELLTLGAIAKSEQQAAAGG